MLDSPTIDWQYFKTQKEYMEPAVHCDTLKNILQFFIEQKGVNKSQLLEGLSCNKNYYFDTANWTSIMDLNRLAWNIHTLFPETTLQDWIEIGRYGYISKVGRIFQTIIPFLSLQYVYSMIPHITRNFYTYITCEMLSAENGMAEMTLRIDPKYEALNFGFVDLQYAGVLSIFPQVKDLNPAKVSIQYSQSKLSNITSHLYHTCDLVCEEKQDGFYIEGSKIADPVFLFDETVNARSGQYSKSSAYILLDDFVIEGKKLFTKGAIYNAPHSRIKFEWSKETLKEKFNNFLKRRSAGRQFLNDISRELHLAEKKFREEDAARIRAENAEQEARKQAEHLEVLVTKRTRDLEKAHEKLVEAEKRVLEKQITGGFSYEMQKTLARADTELKKAGNAPGGNSKICAAIREETTNFLEELVLACEQFDVPNDFVKDKFVLHLKSIANKSTQLNSTLKNIAQDIERGLAITKMLSDYAKLSDIQPGDIEVDVAELLAHYQKKYLTVFKEKDINYRVSGINSAIIKADPHHLHSIFSNLINNSIDALEDVSKTKKTISVEINHESEGGKKGFVVILCDNGIGFDDKIKEEVLKPFFSTKPSTGSGLGLPIVKRLVSLYGGNLKIESKPGDGTCISLFLNDIPPS